MYHIASYMFSCLHSIDPNSYTTDQIVLGNVL